MITNPKKGQKIYFVTSDYTCEEGIILYVKSNGEDLDVITDSGQYRVSVDYCAVTKIEALRILKKDVTSHLNNIDSKILQLTK